MIDRGIWFGDIHSYFDLNLILSSVDIPPAKPKTTYVDIAGGNGSIDLTEAHGEVKFSDRDCKFTFTMNPSCDLSDFAFEEKKTEISNLLNGNVFKITLDKDDEFYYLGRCSVSEYLSDRRIRQFVVEARVQPYKLKQTETVMSFDLTTEPQTVSLTNGRKIVSPVFNCSNNNTNIVFDNVYYSLDAGKHKLLGVRLKKGLNSITISGSGTLTISYQEGEL